MMDLIKITVEVAMVGALSNLVGYLIKINIK